MDTPKLKTLNDEGKPKPLKKKQSDNCRRSSRKMPLHGVCRHQRWKKYAVFTTPEGRIHFYNSYIIEVMESTLLMPLSWLPSTK